MTMPRGYVIPSTQGLLSRALSVWVAGEQRRNLLDFEPARSRRELTVWAAEKLSYGASFFFTLRTCWRGRRGTVLTEVLENKHKTSLSVLVPVPNSESSALWVNEADETQEFRTEDSSSALHSGGCR